MRVMVVGMLLLFLQGCSKIESSDLNTSGMYARLDAEDDGTEVRVTASLSTSDTSNDSIALSNGDRLTANLRGITKDMYDETSVFGEHVYTTTFPSAPGQPVRISLLRDSGTGAPDSQITLPKAFTIVASGSASYSISGDDPVTVTWTPTQKAALADVTISGSCTNGSATAYVSKDYLALKDTGSYSTTAGALIADFEVGLTDQTNLTCSNLVVEIARSITGGVDSRFGNGGRFTGTETRSATISLVP